MNKSTGKQIQKALDRGDDIHISLTTPNNDELEMSMPTSKTPSPSKGLKRLQGELSALPPHKGTNK